MAELSAECRGAVLDHDAAVHDDVDAAGFGAGGGFEVDDSLLDPEVGQAEWSISSTMAGMNLGRRKTLTMSGLMGRSERVA